MNNLFVFTVKRFIAMVFVIWVITTIVFFLAHLSPINPIQEVLQQHYHEGNVAQQLRHEFHLDQPMWQQYTSYLVDLAHGNLGYSIQSSTLGQPVWNVLRSGVPQSLKLGGLALLVALIVGLPIGMISAIKQNSAIDHGGQFVMMVAYAVPAFVVAPIAQLVFGVKLHWLPVAGWGEPGIAGIKDMIMPVAIFGLGIAGYFAKSFRSFMLEVLQQDYIRTARSKGLKERVVIYLHALKNTLLPLATIVGPTIAFLVAGAFIIESFFNIPGIGNITVQAVVVSDYPIIEATTILVAVSVVVINFLTDVFYAMIDPRVRL
jgi:ABC-type dipeptide/oligopeptide/nickel transport system permease component